MNILGLLYFRPPVTLNKNTDSESVSQEKILTDRPAGEFGQHALQRFDRENDSRLLARSGELRSMPVTTIQIGHDH